MILEAIALDRAQENKVFARYKGDREEQYREIIGRCANFEAEIVKRWPINKFTCAEREKDGTDIKRLQSWLDKIRKFNFYGGTQAEEAAARLKACEGILDVYAQQVFEAHGENQ